MQFSSQVFFSIFFFQAAKMDFKIVQEQFHIDLEDDSLSHLFRHVSEIANETKGGTYIAQCGNCRIFLLLRFYVKSKLAY